MFGRHPTALVSIWGVEMKAIHFPFAYLVLTVLMGYPYADLLHGIAMGHLFYFLVDAVPIVYGKDVLHTPQFLIDRLGVGAYVPPAEVLGARGGAAQGSNVWRPPGRANAPQDPARPARGHDWGSGGQRLGSSLGMEAKLDIFYFVQQSACLGTKHTDEMSVF
ncbi:LOW QUALITY PROTEIN: hypothetical protein HJC23_004339 [Cyclotella cryptica]|uniref:Derlin n=1 Tax=Cyclotella cryptica TaxID=29204 RepID=A0ABD3NH01_9STRA